MTLIVKIDENKSILVNYEIENRNKIKRTAYTVITTNYTLFRYLLKLTDTNSIHTNGSGYITLRRENRTVTSLQQIIMEFYSNYDKSINLSDYEVDHINANKIDNRITNLQILKHSENIKKAYNKEYNVEIESNYIQQLDKKIKNNRQYQKDKRYMEDKSNKMYKLLNQKQYKYLKDCCYLDILSNIIVQDSQISTAVRDEIDRAMLYVDRLLTNKYKYLIIYYRNRYIMYKTFDNNLKILVRYMKKYKYLDEVLRKYKIMDLDYDKTRFNTNLDNIMYSRIDKYIHIKDEASFNELVENMGKSKHVLYDLYEIMTEIEKSTIKDDNVLSTITVGFEVDNRGKYSILRIMYLLGLLKRHNSSNRMSFFSVPYYTEELLKKSNVRAKKILELGLKKIRYFTIVEEFGKEIAKEVYGERTNKLKSRYDKYSVKVKEIIIEFIKTDQQIRKMGFAITADIVEYIEWLNSKKLANIPIHRNFETFIKEVLMYNTDVKKVMKENGFEYRTINKNIIENVRNYQESQGQYIITTGLHSRGKGIVLTELTK